MEVGIMLVLIWGLTLVVIGAYPSGRTGVKHGRNRGGTF